MIIVLQLSESFSAIWPELDAHLRTEVRTASSVAGLGSVRGAAAAVVSAAGVEGEAAEAIRALQTAGVETIAVVGAATDHRTPVLALAAGASSYFALPPDLSLLRSWLAEQTERAGGLERTRALAEAQRRTYDFAGIIGHSPALQRALDRARRVIPASTTVLITGETGTGKELLAHAIHHNGPRAAAPLVEINCAAMPAGLIEAELFGYDAGAFTDARSSKPGLFEVADGGTLFLDEIAELPLELQAKLLKVLDAGRIRRLGSIQERVVDVRMIAATHRDLQEAVRRRTFREDLYYRLTVVPIHLPALRERGDDVLELADHFLRYFAARLDVSVPRLTAEVRKAMLAYSWPGNIRELRNAVERAVVLSDGAVDPDHLFYGRGAPGASGFLPFPASLRVIERAAAIAMVERLGGNKSLAARSLGITRKRLYALLDAARGAETDAASPAGSPQPEVA